MGFESFTIVLSPDTRLSLQPCKDGDTQGIANDIRQHWPAVGLDAVERNGQEYLPDTRTEFLVYEAAAGLFQILIEAYQGQVGCSLRFALCNPRTVYEPFLDMAAWLMRRYRMNCRILSDGLNENVPNEIFDPEKLTSALTPSMDFNKRLWQMDAGMEEARLRPGEAINRFILHAGIPV